MSTVIRTMECFPHEIDLFGTIIPAPDADHAACSVGHHVEGLIGGWHCPCECHHHVSVSTLDRVVKILDEQKQEEMTTKIEEWKYTSSGGLHPQENSDDIIAWLKDQFLELLIENLSNAPWWCIVCGAGGNYEGERPDKYLPPPQQHVCDLGHVTWSPSGITKE